MKTYDLGTDADFDSETAKKAMIRVLIRDENEDDPGHFWGITAQVFEEDSKQNVAHYELHDVPGVSGGSFTSAAAVLDFASDYANEKRSRHNCPVFVLTTCDDVYAIMKRTRPLDVAEPDLYER